MNSSFDIGQGTRLCRIVDAIRAGTVTNKLISRALDLPEAVVSSELAKLHRRNVLWREKRYSPESRQICYHWSLLDGALAAPAEPTTFFERTEPLRAPARPVVFDDLGRQIVTAEALGDPLPGRSAFDQRQRAG